MHYDFRRIEQKWQAFWEANGTAYMAMPNYQGRTLREIIRTDPQYTSEANLKALIAPLLDAVALLRGLDGGGDHHAPVPMPAGTVRSAGSPASKAARPASTAIRKAAAMRFGSFATAIAVLTSTASAPISIASAA